MKTPYRKKVKSKYAIKLKHIPVLPPLGSGLLLGKKGPRKKVNFMVDLNILEGMKIFVPFGDRSDFVNDAVAYALKKAAQREAMEFMDKVRKEGKLQMTDKEIKEAINYGRK
ncbi:MAG: hypothetical protein AAB588_00100 [Patescibacteria group bacterium]